MDWLVYRPLRYDKPSDMTTIMPYDKRSYFFVQLFIPHIFGLLLQVLPYLLFPYLKSNLRFAEEAIQPFIRSLFVAVNDEVFYVREAAIMVLGRLTQLNPAHVMPALRRMLVQVSS